MWPMSLMSLKPGRRIYLRIKVSTQNHASSKPIDFTIRLYKVYTVWIRLATPFTAMENSQLHDVHWCSPYVSHNLDLLSGPPKKTSSPSDFVVLVHWPIGKVTITASNPSEHRDFPYGSAVFSWGIFRSPTPQTLRILVQDADVMPQDPGFSHGHDTLRQVRHKSWAGLPGPLGPPGRG